MLYSYTFTLTPKSGNLSSAYILDYVGNTNGARVANLFLEQGASHNDSFALEEPAVAVSLVIETTRKNTEVEAKANGTVGNQDAVSPTPISAAFPLIVLWVNYSRSCILLSCFLIEIIG